MEIMEPAATASAVPHAVSSVSENIRERETFRLVNAIMSSVCTRLFVDQQPKLTSQFNLDTTI